MSLLLLFGGGGGGGTIVTSGDIVAILTPDEIPIGETTRLFAAAVDNAGIVALDAAPQITVWTVDNAGARSLAVNAQTMTAGTDVYYYDWTPAATGSFIVQVAGLISAAAVFTATNITVRPRFDPIGLAVSDVLVSRM